MKKFNIGSLFCHLYILILILSYFTHELNFSIKFMVLITGDFLTACILLELKKLLNDKCHIKNLNFYIYSFIVLEFISALQFFLPLVTSKKSPDFLVYIPVISIISIISIILQFLYAFLILKSNFKKIKFLNLYGYCLLLSVFSYQS